MTGRAAVLLACLAGVSRAGSPADPPDASIRCERAALRARARGDDPGALRVLRDGIARLARAGRPDAAGIEILLRRHHEIAARLGRFEDERALCALVASSPGIAPNGRALASIYAAGAAWRLGREDEAWSRWRDLGFVLSWWICGAFDNERGRGFDRAFGPEKPDLRLDARYPGKEREVGWRPLPAPPPFGIVDLDALLRPHDEVLAYAVAFVEAPSAADAALRVASDEGIRVWLNGAEVLSRDVERSIGFDQDVAAARLARGWNRILVKVTEAKGAWAFRLRITRPDGSPLPTALRALGPGDPVPDAIPASRPAACEVRRGALDALDAEIARDPDRFWPHFRRAFLLADLGAHDRAEHPDEDEARRAVALAPRDPDARALLARTLGRVVRAAAEREENRRRREREEAVALDPSRARDALELARLAWDLARSPARARSRLAKALAANPRLAGAHALEAEIRAAEALPHERDRYVEREILTREDLRGIPWVERERAAVLERRGRLAEAASVLRAVVRRNRMDEAAIRRRVALLVRLGEDEEARRALEAWARALPYRTEPLLRMARLLRGRDRGEEAAAAYRRALAIAAEDADLQEEFGRLLWERGRDEEAFAAWDRALALEPNRPELRRYRDLVRRRKRSLADRYGEDLGAAIREALRTAQEPEGVAYRVLLDKTVVRLNPDGTTREFAEFAAKVLNEQGVRAFDRFRLGYVPSEQAAEFLEARVFRPDGRIERARLPSAPRGGGRERRTLSVDLPPVAAGDVVQIRYRIQDTRPSFFGDYFGRRVLFGSAQPAARTTFILLAPPERELAFHWRNGELPCRKTERDGAVEYLWERRDAPRLQIEPAMPPLVELVPALEISTFSDWAAFARWYWGLVRREFRASPAIRRKARELVEGRADRRERIRAIYRFVTREIRYEAWEIGVHGYQPYSAEAIFARRFGDCKDKAALMTVMLGEVGIRAHPVLIRATMRRFREDPTLPMIGHFNHCIAYVPPEGEGEGTYLDGTAQRTGMQELPGPDRGATVLVLDGERGAIRRIPWNRPEENAVRETHRIRLAADRSAALAEALEARGDFAVRLRTVFEIPDRRRPLLGRVFGRRHAGARVDAVSFSDLKDLASPARMDVGLAVPRFVEEVAGGLSPPLPGDFFDLLASLAPLVGRERRTHDAVLGPPYRIDVETILQIPGGWTVRSLPRPVEVSSPAATFSAHFEAKGREIRVQRSLVVRAPRVPRDGYPAFRAVAVAIDALAEQRILLEEARR